MYYQTLCPYCLQGHDIDDAEYDVAACPHCGYEWICNVDAEPEGSLIFPGPWTPAALELVPQSGDEGADDHWTKILAKPKPRREQPSILQMILPPILGAIAAVFVSISILWYGFGRDFANTGPTVAKYVPWIVPEELRHKHRGRYRPVYRADTASKQQGSFGNIGVIAEPVLGRQPVDPEIQAEINRINSIAATIEEPNEQRENDAPSWSNPQEDAYQKILKIAQPWKKILGLQRETPDTPGALANLLNQPWFRTLIDQAARELPLPTQSESIARFVEAIEWDLTDPTQEIVIIRPEMPTESDRILVWKLSDAVEQFQLREKKGRIDQSSSLLLGTLERNDDEQIVIRIDAIIR